MTDRDRRIQAGWFLEYFFGLINLPVDQRDAIDRMSSTEAVTDILRTWRTVDA